MATGKRSNRSSTRAPTAIPSLSRLRTRRSDASLASSLASQPASERARILSRLSDEEILSLKYDFRFWGRPKQFPPTDDEWLIWLLMTGRGFGKTRSGAEWVIARALVGNKDRWIALIGATPADVRDYQIEKGPSAILRISPPWFRPLYFPSKRSLVWPNGAHGTVFSAEKPDQLRGFSGDTAWVDEWAKFKHAARVLENLLFGLREAKVSSPRICITTTPKPLAVLKELVKDADVRLVTGTSYENRDNLDPRWFNKVLRKYEGTATGAQEIYGRLLDEMPGARWKRAWIDHAIRRVPEDLERIVIAVDPPGSSKSRKATECGISVAGVKRIAGIRHLLVLADLSLKGTPAVWGKAAVDAYHDWRANAIVGEVNYGGEMVEHTIRTVPRGRDVPFVAVTATRGKVLRAEPIAAIYEQGRGHHCGDFMALEDELCTWEPDAGLPSPNRLDALVWAATDLVTGYETITDIDIPLLRRNER